MAHSLSVQARLLSEWKSEKKKLILLESEQELFSEMGHLISFF